MLLKLSLHILNCLELAAAAEQRAREATDVAIRNDNEKLARSWHHLARSYQFVESLERFLVDKGPDNKATPSPDLPLTADEQPVSAEAERTIIRRPRVKHEISFRDRLLNAAQEARGQATGLRPSAERDRLLLKAQQCETATEIDEWVSTPGSKPPDKLDRVKKPSR